MMSCTSAQHYFILYVMIIVLQYCCYVQGFLSHSTLFLQYPHHAIIQRKSSILLNLAENNNEINNEDENKPSATSSSPYKIQRSAFGKAAIGLKRRTFVFQNNDVERETKNNDEDNIINTAKRCTNSRLSSTVSSSSGSSSSSNSSSSNTSTSQTPKATVVLSSKDLILGKEKSGKDDTEIERILERRDSALLALKTHLQLSLDTSLDVLNSHPRLYTDLSDLSSKLLYLLNDINIKPRQLKRMLISHPRLMENVLLDSEDNITNTLEVLQTELGLSIEDIKSIQSKSLPTILSYPRSELRKRILVYKLNLSYPKEELKKLVLKDPRMLRTDSGNVGQILNVFWEELGIEKEDVHKMLGKEILLLTYNAEGNIRPTIRYLKEYEIGKCLGMVERKGQSTIKASSRYDSDTIIRERLKALVMGHPKVLSSSIEKNLKPTVAFFFHECGLTEYEFGRVFYRRGGSLLEANVERTLKRKVSFLRDNLGLNFSQDGNDKDLLAGGEEEYDTIVEIPQFDTNTTGTSLSSSSSSTLSSFQKKRLLGQMLATNPDILTFSIENNLHPKFEYFCQVLGFSRDELRYVLLKRPQLLSLSLERNIVPKINFFLASRRRSTTASMTATTTSTTTSNDEHEGEEEEEYGLGITMDLMRQWLVQYPQTLALVLDSRIKPRVQDVVEMGLFISEDNVLPWNFLTMTERNWKQWKKDYRISGGC